MRVNPSNRVEEVFHGASERTRERRAEYLRDACGDDSALRQEVEALLAADESDTRRLDTPAAQRIVEDSHDIARRAVASGQRIGRYEVVRRLASGGMGDVYEALQDRPRRTVALKLLRTSFASDSERRRFEYEADLLARMRHPHIVQVFEAGVFDDGVVRVPYLATELVAGARTLTQLVREACPQVRMRLELFVKICRAVQHGHEKGVVHRDLKPANILVDSENEPKIIDYGVARALDNERAITVSHTSVGALVGTLQYMSPEQLRGQASDVDTRIDVYALGLVLYEILAERRPYELAGRTLPDAVRELDRGHTASLAAVHRRFRGDLAIITAKAMEKERSRRYSSAAELADDVQRFLSGEPITARAPSTAYQLRRFVRRHKAATAGAVIAALGLTAGLVVAQWRAQQADAARREALIAARTAERVQAFFTSILESADPKDGRADVTVREAIDRAAARIGSELRTEPAVFAQVSHIVSTIYYRLGRKEEARRHIREALETCRRVYGNDDIRTVNAITDLAWQTCDPQECERLFLEAIEICRRLLGPDHPRIATTQTYIAARRVDAGDSAGAVEILRYALSALERTYGLEHDRVAFAQITLAQARDRLNERAEAERLFRCGLATQRKLLGDTHFQVGITLGVFGRFLCANDNPTEGAQLLAEAERIHAQRIGNIRLEPGCTGESP
jgi:non-specific serine/threonine protein kinase/serine/threonine-protein kinase